MDIGKFYFLSNAYLEVFNDLYLMKNSEEINGVEHNRPCFFAFQDFNTMLYWVIPISSRTKKFEKIIMIKLSEMVIVTQLHLVRCLDTGKHYNSEHVSYITEVCRE